MPDPLARRPSPKRELLSDTGKLENGGGEKEESTAQLPPEPEVKPTMVPPVLPPAPAQYSVMAPSSFLPPGQPMSHDRRSKVPFEQRYKKENIQVDRRLLPYFYDLVSRGNSRVSVINEVLLKVLVEAGYPVDPRLLERPFSWDDVPRS